MGTLATAPAEINLDNYHEIKVVGQVREGDILSRDLHLMIVTSVFRTNRTIELRAENADGEPGYNNRRVWVSKHRSSTSVSKALGSFTHIYRRKIVAR